MATKSFNISISLFLAVFFTLSLSLFFIFCLYFLSLSQAFLWTKLLLTPSFETPFLSMTWLCSITSRIGIAFYSLVGGWVDGSEIMPV